VPASGSNFNPRNILYIPVVEIFAFLELKQKLPFFKGLNSKVGYGLVVFLNSIKKVVG